MSKRIYRSWVYEDVLTDVTTAKLSDPTGTYGVKRNDTQAVVVADGTNMTKVSTGVYEHEFDEPEPGLAYTGYVEFVYGGMTFYFEHDIPAVTLDETLTVTYDTLRREIGLELGVGHEITDWSGDATVVADINRLVLTGVRRVMTPPPLPGEKHSHRWSWLCPEERLTTTAPYTTGTVTIVSGVATISGGSWPAWATQGALTIAAGTYGVASVSGADLTLTDASVNADAGTTFSLGRIAYDMPIDYADIVGPLIYVEGQSLLRREVQRISEFQLLNRLHVDVTHGYPQVYCVRVKAVDMTAVTAYELLVSPPADAAYTLRYHYKVAIPQLDDTNAIPPGGDAMGELYLESCLAATEQRFRDGAGLHSQRFMECLIASVAHDRQTSCPDTLGFNRDRSDQLAAFDPEDHWYTDTGLVQYKGYPP